MSAILWWGKNSAILLLALFFLIFGIETLIGSFTLNNPLEFIVYFFSASFMILVSIVGIIYPVCQVHQHFKPRKTDADAKS